MAAELPWSVQRAAELIEMRTLLLTLTLASGMLFSEQVFGKPRDAANPFPGPFEVTAGGTQTVKVWPKP